MTATVVNLRERARVIVRSFVGVKTAKELAGILNKQLTEKQRLEFFQESVEAMVNSELGLAKIEDAGEIAEDLFPESYEDAIMNCGGKSLVHIRDATWEQLQKNREQKIKNLRRTTRAFDRGELRLEKLEKVMSKNPVMTVREALIEMGLRSGH